jgi:hypothetical protein
MAVSDNRRFHFRTDAVHIHNKIPYFTQDALSRTDHPGSEHAAEVKGRESIHEITSGSISQNLGDKLKGAVNERHAPKKCTGTYLR